MVGNVVGGHHTVGGVEYERGGHERSDLNADRVVMRQV